MLSQAAVRTVNALSSQGLSHLWGAHSQKVRQSVTGWANVQPDLVSHAGCLPVWLACTIPQAQRVREQRVHELVKNSPGIACEKRSCVNPTRLPCAGIRGLLLL